MNRRLFVIIAKFAIRSRKVGNMFNRIKAGITAIAAVMSSFIWASCDKFWDDNQKKFGPTTYGPIFEANYNEYCQKYYDNNDFYACLCEKVLNFMLTIIVMLMIMKMQFKLLVVSLRRILNLPNRIVVKT